MRARQGAWFARPLGLVGLPNVDELDLVRSGEAEWSITIAGRMAVKFRGADAWERAQRYLFELQRLALFRGSAPATAGAAPAGAGHVVHPATDA